MELFNEDIIPKRTLGEIVSLDNVVANQSIVNGSFNGGKITIGSGENIFTANKDGIFLGSSSFNTAPFSVNMLGDVIANSIIITGGSLDGTTTIGGRLCSTVAEAIDANGHFIDERFDTDSKTILSDFTFGTSGALQIGTYENGVSGDIRISPNGILGRNKNGDTTFSINGTTGDATFGGTLVAASGTFGTVTAGILSGVEISGSTITGGTIQTATSGQRIRILSDSGESPSQQANSLSLIDDNGNSILNFGTETGIIMAIRPRTDNNSGLIIQTDTDVSYSGNLFVSDIQYEYSTGIAGYFENIGSGECVKIQTDGTGVGLLVTTAGEKTSSTDVVRIDANKKGDALKINKSTNSGRGLFINMTGANNNYQPMYIYNQGLSGSQITQTNSNADSALLIEQSHAGVPPLSLQQYTATNTHFKAILTLVSTKIWVSDGTSPSGSLSGSIGDICLNADSGKVYYCTGTTNWTAL